jgi:hypothetical protein
MISFNSKIQNHCRRNLFQRLEETRPNFRLRKVKLTDVIQRTCNFVGAHDHKLLLSGTWGIWNRVLRSIRDFPATKQKREWVTLLIHFGSDTIDCSIDTIESLDTLDIPTGKEREIGRVAMSEESSTVDDCLVDVAGDATDSASNIDITHVLPNPTLPYYETEANALHESIQDAIQLLQQYSEDFDTMKTNPDQVFESLDQARNRIALAVDSLEKSVNNELPVNGCKRTDNVFDPANVALSEQDHIRIAYLNMITDAFSDVLEDLRSKDTEKDSGAVVDLDILADCLQSGYDMLAMLGQNSYTSWTENDFLWNDEHDDLMNDTADADLTPHERHRQELGFQLIN